MCFCKAAQIPVSPPFLHNEHVVTKRRNILSMVKAIRKALSIIAKR